MEVPYIENWENIFREMERINCSFRNPIVNSTFWKFVGDMSYYGPMNTRDGPIDLDSRWEEIMKKARISSRTEKERLKGLFERYLFAQAKRIQEIHKREQSRK